MSKKYFWLAVIFSLLIISFQDYLFIIQKPVPYKTEMMEAIDLSQKWKKIVNTEKAKLGLHPDSVFITSSGPKDLSIDIIGEEYTETTTTLGSLEAKEISNNPLFSALIVKLIHESEADTSLPVGILASGSFPALTLQTLASLQVMHRKAVIISSLGASSFGANQPGALWLDMEGWLQKYGGCRYRSDLITYGAEGDTAGGIIDEGKADFDSTLARNGRHCYFPPSVNQSIRTKCDLLLKNKIALLINIGGNQTALGYCSHAELIPNGLHKEIRSCPHTERGVISRISESGVPFIHLLNLKNLALKYSITDRDVTYQHPLFFESTIIRWRVAVAIVCLLLLLFLQYRFTKKRNS